MIFLALTKITILQKSYVSHNHMQCIESREMRPMQSINTYPNIRYIFFSIVSFPSLQLIFAKVPSPWGISLKLNKQIEFQIQCSRKKKAFWIKFRPIMHIQKMNRKYFPNGWQYWFLIQKDAFLLFNLGSILFHSHIKLVSKKGLAFMSLHDPKSTAKFLI